MSEDEMDMMEEEVDEAGGEEENQDDAQTGYDNGKGLLEDDRKEAIAQFEKVPGLEKEKGIWGFKALKKLCKIYLKDNKPKKVVEKFKQMMEYGKTAVTNNIFEKGLNSVLDEIGSGTDFALTEEIYTIAIAWLSINNERIWFRTALKFGKLLFDRDEHNKLAKILKDLHKSCQNEKGEDDQKKGSQLVDIYALEIQMYTATKNNKKLKELYEKSLAIRSAIPHPRIMGIIRECGGKMHMREKQWEEAHTDFFEAFKNYDEAGSPRRIQCLKYLVLANMLSNAVIDPFEATEAKPYKNDAEVVAMTSLVNAYQSYDIKEFEKILKNNKKTILDDPFIRDYMDDLMLNIRTQVLLRLLTPYTKIHIGFVSQELNITPKEVQAIMVTLILDNKIRGKIDQVQQILELESSKSSSSSKYKAIEKWATQLSNLNGNLFNKLS